MGSTPIVNERDLLRPDCEPDVSYTNGPFTLMSNRVWGNQRVTVRELRPPSHTHCSKPQGTADLLIAEQEYCSHLHHPNLLLLLSVCLSGNLEQVRLVYERVGVGSLYTILHKRSSEFPGLLSEQIVRILFQVCEALLFLHSRGYVHRSLSSHAVHLVTTDLAKLCNLEYMEERSDDNAGSNMSAAVIPPQLYNWLPPELIWQRVGTVRSDIYSLCTIIQEIHTEILPWCGLDGLMVKELMLSGRSLTLDPRLPTALHGIVQTGLYLRQRDRTLNLQDIRYVLRTQLQGLGLSLEAGVCRTSLSCGSGVVRLGSKQDRLSPELREKPLDCVDGLDPRHLSCLSAEAPLDSRQSDGVCYYEVDHSSSQSYYSTVSQEAAGQDATGLPAAACADTPAHTAQHNKETRAKLVQRDSGSNPMGEGASMCPVEELERIRTSSVRLSGAPDCELCAPVFLEDSGKEQQAQSHGERVRVYSVRYGREIDLESDSSLLLESISEDTPPDQEAGPEHLSATQERVQHRIMAGTLRPPSPGSFVTQRPQAPFLHCATSIQESASLLEWANSSLQRMERRFINSIQALERFADSPEHGQQWEQELELEHGLELEGEQELEWDQEKEWEQLQQVTQQQSGKIAGESHCRVRSQELGNDMSAPTWSTTSGSTDDLNHSDVDPQGGAGAYQLLEGWYSCCSDQTLYPPGGSPETFNLLQEIIEGLRANQSPVPIGCGITAGDQLSALARSHWAQTESGVHRAGIPDPAHLVSEELTGYCFSCDLSTGKGDTDQDPYPSIPFLLVDSSRCFLNAAIVSASTISSGSTFQALTALCVKNLPRAF